VIDKFPQHKNCMFLNQYFVINSNLIGSGCFMRRIKRVRIKSLQINEMTASQSFKNNI
jgi:hypothetical protein